MNKNIKKMICSVFILTVFSTVAAAADNPTYVNTNVYWRLNGYNYADDHYYGEVYLAADSGWCSENHLTSDGNRYDHFHNETTLPIWDGHRQLTITESMVDDYWDLYHSGYVRTAGCEENSNCYGYATGYDIWIEITGVTVILNDDFTATNTPDAELVFFSGSDHMLSITDYFSCPVDVTDACGTHEKYRDSGIYKLFYLYQKWPDPDPSTFLNKSYK
ncbi:MAG: hypothetical protein GY845_31420 [Planctomycetes bacterium]|nr:hypothetical protein [Planctomycetota bacterium]